MRIKGLTITSEYRNLKGLTINLESYNRNTYVVIGNNGAGKSNILEAISSIFRSLYYGIQFEFGFHIRYELFDKRKVCITYNYGKKSLTVKVDGKELRNMDNSVLPRRVICNYSGEDSRLFDRYYKDSYEEYKRTLIHGNANSTLKMIFVNKSFWKEILLIMLATRNEVEAFDKFLRDVIGVKKNSDVKVKLSIDNETLKGWQENSATYYMKRLSGNIDENGEINVEKVNENNEIASDLFNYFVDAKDIVTKLSLNINGYDSSLLSEGEKKLMVIEFILEAISDENSLVLMDEPDSHIHVSRKVELRDYFEQTDNRENIITSHSPSLTAAFDRDAIIMLSNENGHAEVVKKEKQEIVEKLTNGIWSIQEQNMFLTSKKDILIVEGPTDEKYLKAAIKAFHENNRFLDLDFDCLPCGGAANVEMLIDKFKPSKGQLAIAIWDNDGAGQDSMRKVFNLKKDDQLPFAKKNNDVWYTFYPAWKKIPNFNVEDYFIRKILFKYIKSFNGFSSLQGENAIKKAIAKDCDDNKFSYHNFLHFEKLFDHICRIKEAERIGEVELPR